MKTFPQKMISKKYSLRKKRDIYKKEKTKKNKIFTKKIIYILILLILYSSFYFVYHPLNNRDNRDKRFFLMFSYNNEAEMAYIHIWRLYDYIYKFIIIVSNQKFSGLPKNVSFAPFDNELKKFKNKMDVVYFDNI